MIIGITGTLGSGKGTVTDYLVSKGFKHLSVTQYMKGVAQSRGIAPDRMTYHNIANEYRAKSPSALIEATLAEESLEGQNIVIESLHTEPEVRFVQSKGGVVFAVDAPINIRYERISKRGSEKDRVSFEEFTRHEELELNADNPNENNLRKAGAAADYQITNGGTLEDLHEQVDDVLAKIGAA